MSLFHILLVEDNPGDAFLAKEAFEEERMLANISLVGDGQEAMEFLENPENDKPDLILLDLNMPRLTGHEVLERLNASDELCDIPVIILTSSNAPSDTGMAEALEAQGYMLKPMDMKEFIDKVRKIEHFMLELCKNIK